MKRDWFDEQLSGSLDGYASGLDLDAAWSSLQTERQKRRRGFIWFSYFAGLGLVLFAMGWYWLATANDANDLENIELVSLSENEVRESHFTPKASTPVLVPPILEVATAKNEISNSINTPVKHKTTAGTKSKQSTTPPTPVAKAPRSSVDALAALPIARQWLTATKTFIPQSSPPVSSSNEAESQVPRNSYSLGLHGNYRLTQRDFTPGPSIEAGNAGAIEARDVWGTGLGFQAEFRKYWFIRTGFSFSQYMNQFSYDYELQYNDTVSNALIQIITFSDGSTEEIYGEQTVTVNEAVSLQAWQRYNFYQIPLTLGYQKTQLNGFEWRIGAGVIYNLHLAQSGPTIYQPTTPDDVIDLSKIAYRKSNIWEGQLLLEGVFNFEKGWSLTAGVLGTMHLNDLASGTADFTEKYKSVGVQVGVWKRLE